MLFQNENAPDGLFDRLLASTASAGPPITLSSTPTNIPAGFTTDSSHVLCVTGVSTTTCIGALYSCPVGSSGVPALPASAATGFPSMVGPTDVLFADNGSGSGNPPAVADLEWVDVAHGASPTRTASGVRVSGAWSDAYFVPSDALHGVVYVASLPSGATGLFVAAVP